MTGAPALRPGSADVRAAPATGEPLLTAQGVEKRYRAGGEWVRALRALDLTVRRGAFVAVTGPSGSGKTTLLNVLSGLDAADDGVVRLAGEDLHTMGERRRTRLRRKEMGFVFQSVDLVPVLSAVENVELPALLDGVPARRARRRARAVLDRVGLAARADHLPSQLSGGERQRVAIGRALVGQPALVWADEPTGALDSATADRVMELLRGLHEDGLTVIVVTHDEAVAGHATRRIRMRDGAVVADEGTE